MTTRIPRSRNSDTTHYHSYDSLARFLFPISVTMARGLISREEMLLPGNTPMILINWKLRLPLGRFRFPVPLNQQTKRDLQCWLG
jgi:hypothetical protein